jgi:hypothetical protein
MFNKKQKGQKLQTGTINIALKANNGYNAKLIPTMTKEDVEHFWSHVDRSDPYACWDWQGWHGNYNRGHRYGLYAIHGQNFGAHRIAYFLSTGQQPGELVVRHRCEGNPDCVNPKHLHLGTQADNVADREFAKHRRLAILSEKLAQYQVALADLGITPDFE